MSEKCKMFDILVGSILGYGAEVWGIHEAKDIEILHTKFCRWVLYVKNLHIYLAYMENWAGYHS